MELQKKYKVNAVLCKHTSTIDEVYNKLIEVTSDLSKSWEKLNKAKKVLVKFNAVWAHDNIKSFNGNYKELVDPKVMISVLKLLRSKTDAKIIVMDTTLVGDESDVYFKPILEEYGAEFVNASNEPAKWFEVPTGGAIFKRYLMHPMLDEIDAVVSVSKMKSHAGTGSTMSIKNFFGLCPLPPYGRTRLYYHHLVRLPYAMVDFGTLLNPCLNIVDGMICQSIEEWGGQPRIGDCLVAGDQATATDTCGTHLMGLDPEGEWPDMPFIREHNYLKIAAEVGFGTNKLSEIDFKSELTAPIAHFETKRVDSFEKIYKWHETTIEQMQYFLDNKERFLTEYENEYVFLQMDKVLWHGNDLSKLPSRRILSSNQLSKGMWLKYMDPDNIEEEHYEVYEKAKKLLSKYNI